ncbi:MAG TPA: DnaJ domain-containing protein [Candidatus Paceibacterota bacterium]|jgi:DnaJ-class molecular chaperone|nr:DnaJ domain-containing protein [Candidatus Paceibacterota bacterium]
MANEGWKQPQTPQNFYERLGVNPGASDQEIKDAFRTLSKKYHPEAQGGGDEERFKMLSEAYSTLKDSEKRKKYDLRVSPTSQSSSRGDTRSTYRGPQPRTSKPESPNTTRKQENYRPDSRSHSDIEREIQERHRAAEERARRSQAEAEARVKEMQRQSEERVRKMQQESERRAQELQRNMAERSRQFEEDHKRRQKESDERMRRIQEDMAKRQREFNERNKNPFKK